MYIVSVQCSRSTRVSRTFCRIQARGVQWLTSGPQLKAGPLVSRNPPLPSLLDSGTFSHGVDPTCHRLETVTLDLTAGAPSISATSQSRTFSPPKNPRPLVRPLTDSGAHAVGPLGQWPLTPPSSCSARRTPFIRLRPPSRRPHKNPTAASKTLASPSPPPLPSPLGESAVALPLPLLGGRSSGGDARGLEAFRLHRRGGGGGRVTPPRRSRRRLRRFRRFLRLVFLGAPTLGTCSSRTLASSTAAAVSGWLRGVQRENLGRVVIAN